MPSTILKQRQEKVSQIFRPFSLYPQLSSSIEYTQNNIISDFDSVEINRELITLTINSFYNSRFKSDMNLQLNDYKILLKKI